MGVLGLKVLRFLGSEGSGSLGSQVLRFFGFRALGVQAFGAWGLGPVGVFCRPLLGRIRVLFRLLSSTGGLRKSLGVAMGSRGVQPFCYSGFP